MCVWFLYRCVLEVLLFCVAYRTVRGDWWWLTERGLGVLVLPADSNSSVMCVRFQQRLL